VRKLEEVLIRTLSRWEIEGYRLEGKPGVWVRWNRTDAKIAAVGVRLDHGVTIHGFALNVDLDLTPFSYIMPCGLEECHITSMAEIQQAAVSSSVVAHHVGLEFSRIFNVHWASLPPDIMKQKHPDGHLTSMAWLHT
jgi:lipoate-protein ligase B